MATPFFDSQRVLLNVTTNTDLSAQIYRAVQIVDSLTCIAVPSGTGGAIFCGMLESVYASSALSAARVCVQGVTYGIAGAALTAGVEVCVAVNNTAPGYLFEATSSSTYGRTGTTYITGYTLESAAAASQVIAFFVNNRADRIV